MLIEGLASLIPSNAQVATILGIPRLDKTTGVFPNIAPDEVLMPYITFVQVSRVTTMAYSGVNALQQARFRFSCYAPTYRTAKILAEKLKLLLDGYVGQLADGTALENTIPESETDDIETVFKATLYSVHVDYTFVFVDNGVFIPSPPPVPVPQLPPYTQTFISDGTTNVFTLSQVPPGGVMVFWNNLQSNTTADYTISGAVITLARMPEPNDVVVVLVL